MSRLLVAWFVLAVAPAAANTQSGQVELTEIARALGRWPFSVGKMVGISDYGIPSTPGPVSGASVVPLLSKLANLEHSSYGEKNPSRAARRVAAIRLIQLQAAGATKILEEHLLNAPRDAIAWSDLAATLLTYAFREQDAFEIVRAMNAALRALKIEPTLVEAKLNLSIAASELGLNHLANGSPLNPGPDWFAQNTVFSGDAIGHSSDSQSLRERFQFTLLNNWLNDAEAGTLSTSAALSEAHRVASEHFSHSNDSILLRSVDFIGEAMAVGGDHSELALRGHQTYRDGTVHFDSDRFELAAVEFHEASRSLRDLGSPFADLVELDLAVCEYFAGEYDDSIERLTALRLVTESKVVESRSLALEALVLMVQGDLLGARDRFVKASAGYRITGEHQNLAFRLSSLAKIQRLLGARETSWNNRIEALRRLESFPLGRKYAVLLEASDAASEVGFREAALQFADELVRVASVSQLPSILSESLLRRAELHGKLNDRAAAESDLGEAKSAALRVPDVEHRKRITADILAVEGSFKDSWRAARVDFQSALDYYEEKEILLPWLDAKRAAISLRLREEDYSGARIELQALLTVLNRQRSEMLEGIDRGAYFEHTRFALAGLADIELNSSNGPGNAFAYLEQARWQAVTDRLGIRSNEYAHRQRELRPIQLASLLSQARASGSAFLYLADVSNRVVRWLVSRDGISFSSVAFKGDELRSLVEAYDEELRSARGKNQRLVVLGQRLGSLVLPNELASLRAGTDVRFVTSENLSDISMEFLILPDSREFVVERFKTSELFAASNESPPRSDGANRSFLFIADPLGRPGPLPRLKDARENIHLLSALHSGGETLSDDQSTVEVLLKQLPSYDVLHFAGHATSASLGRSAALHLRPSERFPDGLLRSGAIADLDLGSHRPTIILASCGVGMNEVNVSFESHVIAGSFLSADARAVLFATGVVDDSTTALFTRFIHEELSAGAVIQEALRKAQLAFIDMGNLFEASKFRLTTAGLSLSAEEEM